MHTVLYARVSSDDQRDRQTIQAQIVFAKKYCDLHQIRLDHIYKDDGITGTIPLDARPAGKELMRAARDGKISTVLIFKLDRLGRNTRVILNAVHDLDDTGAKVKSMTEPFDTNDASGRFLLTILAGVADLERSNILQRMSLGADRVAREGKWLGGLAPYGYYKGNDGYLHINDAPPAGGGMSEKQVIEFIYRQLGDEKVTCQQIADKLNALHVPTLYDRRGLSASHHACMKKKWVAARISSLANMTTYYGLHQYGKHSKKKDRPIITRQVPPIVSKKLWDRARATLQANQKFAPRNAKNNTFLLRGLIRCADCGHHFRTMKARKMYAYYSCNGRAYWKKEGKEKPCPSMSINAAWLDKVVWEDCLSYIRDPQLVEKEIKDKLDTQTARKKEIQLARLQLDGLAAEKERLLSLYATGLITLDDISARLKSIKGKHKALQEHLKTLQEREEPTISKEQLEETRSALARLQASANLPDLPIEQKQKIVRSMIDHIDVKTIEYKKKAQITIYHTFAAYARAPRASYDVSTVKRAVNRVYNSENITFSTTYIFEKSA